MSLSNFILDLEPLVNTNSQIQDDGLPPGEHLREGDHVVVGLLSDGTPILAESVDDDAPAPGTDPHRTMARNGVIDMVVAGYYNTRNDGRRHELHTITKLE